MHVGLTLLLGLYITLESEMHTTHTGHWAHLTHVIGMPPWKSDAKIYRTVRLQNTAGATPWNIQASTIFASPSEVAWKRNLCSLVFCSKHVYYST